MTEQAAGGQTGSEQTGSGPAGAGQAGAGPASARRAVLVAAAQEQWPVAIVLREPAVPEPTQTFPS